MNTTLSEEMETALQRKLDEELVRKLHALHYEGEMTAEEMKNTLRDSHQQPQTF